jgi:hypothetical protein
LQAKSVAKDVFSIIQVEGRMFDLTLSESFGEKSFGEESSRSYEFPPSLKAFAKNSAAKNYGAKSHQAKNFLAKNNRNEELSGQIIFRRRIFREPQKPNYMF